MLTVLEIIIDDNIFHCYPTLFDLMRSQWQHYGIMACIFNWKRDSLRRFGSFWRISLLKLHWKVLRLLCLILFYVEKFSRTVFRHNYSVTFTQFCDSLLKHQGSRIFPPINHVYLIEFVFMCSYIDPYSYIAMLSRHNRPLYCHSN